MVLSEIGKIVKNEWKKTFEMRPDMNLMMGEFVVMPNHFHAIIRIGPYEYNSVCRTPNHCGPASNTMNQFGPQSKNLPSIIRGFKTAVTKDARIINPDFKWQMRYHDHIIRNEKSYHRITKYILDNPGKWGGDGI